METGFEEIVSRPLCYLVCPAQNEEEADEAARIISFFVFGSVLTGTTRGSMFTAHRIKRDFELQTDDSKWPELFEQRLHDTIPAVLVMPADQIEQISAKKPDTGSVVAVFERNDTLVFEQFN